MFQIIDQSLFELINVSAHNAVFNFITARRLESRRWS